MFKPKKLTLLKSDLMKTKFTIKIMLFLFLCNVGVLALKAQNHIWSLPGQSLKFPLGTGFPQLQPLPIPLISPWPEYYQGQQANYSHNAMQDAQGNLLFFIVDDKLYDKDGYLIDQLMLNGRY